MNVKLPGTVVAAQTTQFSDSSESDLVVVCKKQVKKYQQSETLPVRSRNHDNHRSICKFENQGNKSWYRNCQKIRKLALKVNIKSDLSKRGKKAVPVARACGRSPAEIALSNPGGGMDVCLL